MKRCAVLAILVAVSPFIARSEVSFGGSGTIQFGCLINTADLLASRTDPSAEFSPLVYAFGEVYEMVLRATILQTDGASSIAVDELSVKVNPNDFVSVRIGRFAYLPGAAEYFSNVNYFSRTDTVRLLTSAGSGHLIPTELVQAGLFVGDVFLLVTASLIRPTLIFPDAESVWFPDAQFPSTITVYFPSEHDLVLDAIYFADEEFSRSTLIDAGVCVEAGATVWAIDLSLLYYHGWDNTPLAAARLRFPSGLVDSYEISLRPVYRRIDAIGAMVATSMGNLRLYLDSSYTFSKTFLTNRLSSKTFETPVVELPYLGCTVGASYEIPFLDLLLLAEYTDGLIVGETVDSVRPMLSRAVISGLRFSPWRLHLDASVVGIVSIADWSFVVASQLSYRPSEDLEIYVFNPLFRGDLESELGQFRSNLQVSAGIRWFF